VDDGGDLGGLRVVGDCEFNIQKYSLTCSRRD
jgi:hypothetical protein